ncbi:MAG: ankyrin repeat domain-containing protein [Rickettsiales bacterium]
MKAIKATYEEAIKLAKGNGGKDLAGSSYLHIACQFGKVNEVKEFIASGVDVNALNNFKKTPAHLACYAKQKEILQLLIDGGADINIQDDFGNTLIHVCAAIDDVEMAQMLIDRGADLTIRDIYGCSALHQCAVANNYKLASILSDKIFVDVIDKFHNTPLCTACSCGAAETALILAKKGADIEHINMYNVAPVDTIKEIFGRVA